MTPPAETPKPTDPVAPSLLSQKPAEPEAAAPAPLTVEAFKDLIPTGTDASTDPHFTKFLEVMNDTKLDASQRGIELYKLQTDVMKGLSEKGASDFAKTNEDWQAATVADPLFADGKLAPALAQVSKLVDKYGTAELRAALDLTGAGNHPEVVKFFYKIAKDLNEPGADPINVRPPSAEKTQAQRLYG